MDENWMPALGWEGIYEVSDLGQVRSLDRIVEQRDGTSRFFPGRVLSQTNMNGYRTVALHMAGNESRRTVHSLVLEAFVSERPEGMQACHYDGKRSNNVLTNLRWDTAEANMKDKVRHGTNCKPLLSHCRRGHEMDNANTYVAPSGARYCKTCQRASNKANYYKNLESKREYARNFYRENYATPAEPKAECKRGHQLQMPNLMPSAWSRGHRACLACSRAHAYVNRHAMKESIGQVSDRYYLEVLKGTL